MFLVIEGLDGSGKSTQVNLVKEYFEKENIKYKYLHFPITDSPIFGELIAKFLRGDLGSIDSVNPYLVALIYAGDRYNSGQQIREWMDKGYLILVDRYVFSNIAFQCAKLSDKKDQEKLAEWILDLEYDYYGIPRPDINLFLDVPFEFTQKKLTEDRSGDNDRDYLKGKEDIHEKDLGFQQKVKDIYIHQVEKYKDFEKINCENEKGGILAPDIIFKKILNRIKPFL